MKFAHRRSWLLPAALLAIALIAGWEGLCHVNAIPVLPRLASSKVVGTPEPPPAYRLLPIGEPPLKNPVHIIASPHKDEIWITELCGRILSLATPYSDSPEIIAELEGEVWSLAFHPDFEKNGRLFATMVKGETTSREHVVSVIELAYDLDRSRMKDAVPRTLLSFRGYGHVGGALEFGRDGLLYIATGDSGNSEGTGAGYETGQDLSDLLGAILRIDVDHTEPGREYGIPADNPFVNQTNARPEIWAYGLRNPWKMTRDLSGDRFWVADVGEESWESVFLVSRGDNCGWPLYEGSHPFRLEGLRGPTPAIPPVLEHSHSQMQAIVGGRIIENCRFPELNGTYLYGEHATGAVFAARRGQQPKEYAATLLAKSRFLLTGFCIDRAGEILAITLDGKLCRLEPHTSPKNPTEFPQRLSESGLFESLTYYRLKGDLVPYDVNSPLYSDGASKERHFYLPPGENIEFSVRHCWVFPDQTLFVKTFSVEAESAPGQRRRIETRFLHYSGGDWNGYSYRWNSEQTDAELVSADGDTFEYSVSGSSNAAAEVRQWRFPSRVECMMCHTMGAAYVLGVNTAQLNRPTKWNGHQINQIELFESLGLFTKPLPRLSHMKGLLHSSAAHTWPCLVDPLNPAVSLESRARSYLHANCAHCHRYLGGGNSSMWLNYDAKPDEMRLMDVEPLHGSWGLDGARIVAPGSPDRSVLLHRMNSLGRERMPRIGSRVIDQEGVQLIRDWISNISQR